jgi:hypothetical protein
MILKTMSFYCFQACFLTLRSNFLQFIYYLNCMTKAYFHLVTNGGSGFYVTLFGI